MALNFLGKKSIAAAVPLLGSLMLAIDVPGLAAKLAGLIKLNASLAVTPPSIGANIALAAKILANAQVSIAPPSISFNLNANIAPLQLLVDLALEIKDLLLAAGVHLYAFDGTAAGLGGAVAAEFVPGPSQGGIAQSEGVYVVMLVIEANNSATVTATKRVFGT
jgi:hypothetical protein